MTTGEQVGFARVVTDKATYAWVCNVYVDQDARGRSAGKSLMAAIVAAMDALGVQRVVLATADAHGLYEKYGVHGARPARSLDDPPADRLGLAHPLPEALLVDAVSAAHRAEPA